MHAISQMTQNQEFCSTYPKLAVSEKNVVDFTKNTAYNICLFWFHDFDFLQFRRNNTCRGKKDSFKEECQISHFAQCLGQFSSFVEHKIFMLKRVNELFFLHFFNFTNLVTSNCNQINLCS